MKSGAQTTALDLDNLVATAASWTCACERRFGFISSLLTFLGGLSSSILNDSAPPVEDYTYMLDMAAITSLWATVDEVHDAVRRMMAALPTLNVVSSDGGEMPFAGEAYSLPFICVSTRLAGLSGLVHRYLGRLDASSKRSHQWEPLFAISEERVRKAIKLFA